MQLVPRRLADIIAENVNVQPEIITLSTHFNEDLKVESLDFVQIILSCEEEFNLKIRDAEAQRIRCVEDLVLLLERDGVQFADKKVI